MQILKRTLAVWAESSTSKILKQFLSEFAVPFGLALLWTWWDSTKATGEYDWLAKLPLHFFAVGWVFQQWNRIKKQKRTEDGMGNIKSSVEDMISNLEDSTRRMIGHSTGGTSFCELIAVPQTPLFPNAFGLLHHGDFPLYNVTVRIVDLDRFDSKGQTIANEENRYEFDILIPHHIQTLVLKSPPRRVGTSIHRFNIHVTARNGSTEQMFQMKNVNGFLRTATVIHRGTQVVFEDAASDYPRDDNDKIDWKGHYLNKRFNFTKDIS